MMKSGSFSYAGSRHGLLPERNEDAVAERDCGTHKVVVLCDGASCCANGKAAARLTADALAGFLAFRFGRCLLEAQDVLRREVVKLITEVLTEAARAAGADPASFGCTVMAAAMDRQGRWCLFHLGDGTALGRMEPDSGWAVFSHPQSGLVPGGTSLTMNGAMFDNLRFYRQAFPAGRALVLATDGALELLVPRLLSGKTPEPPDLSELPEAPEDDCSAAWLIAVPGAENRENAGIFFVR